MEEVFVIHAYTKAELACLYNPGQSIPCALRTLSRWITACSSLTTELATLEYNHRSHTYTPMQVRAIVRYLGEP